MISFWVPISVQMVVMPQVVMEVVGWRSLVDTMEHLLVNYSGTALADRQNLLNRDMERAMEAMVLVGQVKPATPPWAIYWGEVLAVLPARTARVQVEGPSN